jgi:hypothetical protein
MSAKNKALLKLSQYSFKLMQAQFKETHMLHLNILSKSLQWLVIVFASLRNPKSRCASRLSIVLLIYADNRL